MEKKEKDYYHEHREGMPVEQEIAVPKELDKPIYVMFIAKIGFLLISFALLGVEIVQRQFG